jgi:signal transduction histidine kinase
VRLAVALNGEYLVGRASDLEEKIIRISTISERLGVTLQQLDDITGTIFHDTVSFAGAIDVEIEDYETLLTRANREIFRTYFAIQRVFRERQELTRNILNEEREKGVLEARQIAISTLSHYINNAVMIISGQAQVLRMSLGGKSADEIEKMIPRLLDCIDDSVRKIVAVLDEISETNVLDDVEYFEQSKVLNIDDRIKERLHKLKEVLPFGSPDSLRVPADEAVYDDNQAR